MSDIEKAVSETVTGGCLCGAVRYEADKSAFRTGCCHCRMCQKATGAPFISFVHIPNNAFRYTAGEPKLFNASEISDSAFCGDCGTTIMIRYYPEYYDSYVVLSATLDEPNKYPPERHSGVESQMHWLKLDDDLPRTEHVEDFIEKWKSGVDFRHLLRPV
jgi:hypothetical protein